MICLLDTNACNSVLNNPNSPVAERLRGMKAEQVRVCSVVKAELFYGARKSRWSEKSLALQHEFLRQFISLPFDGRAAEFFGQIRGNLVTRGTPIGPYDLQIAAIALANGCTLITHNVREFSRIDGLTIEDWEI